jgi:cobalt/nickel transport protein
LGNNAINKIKQSRLYANLLLIFLVIVITVVPLFIFKDKEIGGADNKAEAAVLEIAPDYVPWFSSFFRPESKEMENIMFAFQAALGAGVIVYGLRYLKKSRK